jgi:hypothetical protein
MNDMTSTRLVFATLLGALVLTPGLWAQDTQVDRNMKSALNELRSADPKVVSNAAAELGSRRATAAVPKLLEALQGPRRLVSSEHVSGSGVYKWILIDGKKTIVRALGEIGDARAVPLLALYLRAPRAGLDLAPEEFARALFLITGIRYQYRDHQAKIVRYLPGEFDEEEARRRFRPDLVPTDGLTTALKINGTGPGMQASRDNGGSWLGSKPLIIQLSITNHSDRPMRINLSPDRFVFSSLDPRGLRTTTPATDIQGMQPPSSETAVVPAGATIRVQWTIEKLAASTISRAWHSGYVNIKCAYRREGAGKQLVVSNSAERYYYSTD